MREVLLGGEKAAGRVALVDDEDYALIRPHRWHVLESVRRNGRPNGPYAVSTIRQSEGRQALLLMHKLITSYPMTDHIDHNGLNNQRSNLRPATLAKNAQNKYPSVGCASPYKGVRWNPQGRGRWEVWIQADRQRYYLGRFADEIEAALAYDAAAKDLHGEFAYLNFGRIPAT